MFKSFVLGLYASGHSLHVRTHKLSRVNKKSPDLRFGKSDAKVDKKKDVLGKRTPFGTEGHKSP